MLSGSETDPVVPLCHGDTVIPLGFVLPIVQVVALVELQVNVMSGSVEVAPLISPGVCALLWVSVAVGGIGGGGGP